MQYPATSQSSRISEIFSSIQGEGIHFGERHLFIRFEECHIHCTYCDELEKPGQWLTLNDVVGKVLEMDREEGPHSYVSLTGGEPLLYVNFLKPLMMQLKAHRFHTYLETNGILWKALEEVIGWCDCIAMDMKPASVTKEKNFDEDHFRFLEIANSKNTFVKIVVSKDIDINEFENEIRIVSSINQKIPVILMPISTEREGHEDPYLLQVMLHLQRVGLKYVNCVRIIPRFHKIMNLR